MRLEDLKELNLPHYKHDPTSKEIEIGEAIAKAEISITADAWVEGYAKNGNSYCLVFQRGISQIEDSRFPGSKHEPKKFQIYVVGIVEEKGKNSLAYAQSINDKTQKIHTLRLTDLGQIVRIGDYRLILKG